MSFQTEKVRICSVCGSSHLQDFDPSADLQQCRDCTYVFANPRPTLAELDRYYSKPAKYDHWVDAEAERDALWKRRLKKIRRHAAPGTLLDVGAGIGQLLGQAKTHFTAVFGTELSDSGIQIAREKYGVALTKGDLESITFGRTFDNITLFHLLEHVHNPGQLLAKCHRLLTPGGRLIIAVPNDLDSWELKVRTWLKRVRGTLAPTIGRTGLAKILLDGSVDEIHLSQFSVGSLRRLLKENRFDIVSLSLDPYFAKSGWKYVAFRAYYLFHSLLWTIFRINRYNTIWAVATPVERRPS